MIRPLTPVFRNAGVQRGDSVHVGFDISGGTPLKLGRDVLEEVATACDNLQVFELRIYQFDTAVRKIDKYQNGAFDKIRDITIHLGGGTLIHPLLDYFAAIPPKTSPKFFACTDGLFELDPEFPEVPVTYLIWRAQGMSMAHLPKWVPVEQK